MVVAVTLTRRAAAPPTAPPPPRPAADPASGWLRSAGPTRCRPASRRRPAPRGRARRTATPAAPAQRGSSVPSSPPMSPRPAGGEHGVGERVRHDVAVRVPGAAVGARPLQAGQPQRAGAVGAYRCTSTPTPTRGKRFTPPDAARPPGQSPASPQPPLLVNLSFAVCKRRPQRPETTISDGKAHDTEQGAGGATPLATDRGAPGAGR